MECSAKMRVNIEEAFGVLVRTIVSAKSGSGDTGGGNNNNKNNNLVAIEEPQSPVKRKKNPALAMDRSASMSKGGLGGNNDSSTKCKCLIS